VTTPESEYETCLSRSQVRITARLSASFGSATTLFKCVKSLRVLSLQIYGVPTVRKDIKAPKKQSIANAQNYGNEPNSMQLIHPSATAERGVNEQHYNQQMSKDALR
jgi:hypothetical protein